MSADRAIHVTARPLVGPQPPGHDHPEAHGCGPTSGHGRGTAEEPGTPTAPRARSFRWLVDRAEFDRIYDREGAAT